MPRPKGGGRARGPKPSAAVEPIQSPRTSSHASVPQPSKDASVASQVRVPDVTDLWMGSDSCPSYITPQLPIQNREATDIHPAVASIMRAELNNSNGFLPNRSVVPMKMGDLRSLGESIRSNINRTRAESIQARPESTPGVIDLTSSGWQAPCVDLAIEHGLKSTFLEGKGELWHTQVDDFTVLGPGVSMYFWMLKSLAVAFVIMTLCLSFTFVLTATGSRISADDVDAFGFARVTVGNIGSECLGVACVTSTNFSALSNASVATDGFAFDYVDIPAFGRLSAQSAGFVVTISDIFVLAVFLGFVVMFRRRIEDFDESSKSNDKLKGASSYTVYVRNVPADVTEEEVRRHFSTLYALHKPDWGFPGYLWGCISKKRSRFPFSKFHRFVSHSEPDEDERTLSVTRNSKKYPLPVENIEMTRNPAYYGSWVADVTVIRGCGAEIRIYLAVQSVSRQLQIARARMELFPADDSLTARRHFKAKADIEELSKKLMVLLSKLRKLDYLTGDNRHSSISYVPSAGEAHKASVVHRRASLNSASVSAHSNPRDENPDVTAFQSHTHNSWRSSQQSSSRSVDSSSTSSSGHQHGVDQRKTVSRAGPSSRKDVQLSLKSFSGSENQSEMEEESQFASTMPSHQAEEDSESDDCDEYNIYGDSPPSVEDMNSSNAPGLCILLDDGTKGVIPKSWFGIRKVFETMGARGFKSKSERRKDIHKRWRERQYSMADAVLDLRADIVGKHMAQEGIESTRRISALYARGRPRQRIRASVMARRHRKSVEDIRKAEVIHKERQSAYAAFVVFNHEESFRRCVEDYSSSRGFFGRLFQPPALRLKGMRIRVEPAMEPSTILWENLDTTDLRRSVRRIVTSVLSLLLLAVSFSILYYTQQTRLSFQLSVPEVSVCETFIPSALLNLNSSYTPAQASQPVLMWDPRKDNGCSGLSTSCFPPGSRCPLANQVYLAAKEGNMSSRSMLSTYSFNLSDTNPCTSPCVDSKTTYGSICPPTVAGMSNYDPTARIQCFCYASLMEYVQEAGTLPGGYQFLQEQGSLCGSFGRKYIQGQVFKVAASFILVIINLVLKTLLKAMGDFEWHVSSSERDSALTWKLFLGEFLNTGVLPLVMFAKLPFAAPLPLGLRVFDGEFSGMPPRWYAVVGSYLTLTVLVDVATPILFTLIKVSWSKVRRRRWFTQWKLTQDDLDKLFIGPRFNLATRISSVLTTAFVAMMFCGGLPLLVPIAACGFTAQYWMEKIGMLRYYKKSDHYGIELPRVAMRFLPYAVLIHLVLSLWFYGDPQTLPSHVVSRDAPTNTVTGTLQSVYASVVASVLFGYDGVVSVAVRRTIAIPLVVMLLFMVVGIVCYYTFFAVRSVLTAMEVQKALQGSATRSRSKQGCCQRRRAAANRQTTMRDEENIDFSPGITEVYAQWLGQYWGRPAEELNIDVNTEDSKQGWQIELGKEGCLWLCKAWKDTGDVSGVHHSANQLKRTWEVLRDEGTHSFKMEDNDKYKHALRTQVIVFQSEWRDRRKSLVTL